MKTTTTRTTLAGTALLALALLAGRATPAHAQAAPCRFQTGFADLAARLGERAGSCLEDERPTERGDAEQRTTAGVLVWRRADNRTVFTDGARTWVLGPEGLAERGNTERFAWEPDAGWPGTTPVGAPPAAEPQPTAPGTQLGLPVSGRTLTITAEAVGRVPGGPSGNRLLRVTVKVEPGANGSHVGRFDYWDFRLRSPQGVEFQPSAYAAVTRPGALSSGTLTRDQFVVGDVYFEVPDDGQGYGLHYYPQGLSGPQVAISRWLGGVA